MTIDAGLEPLTSAEQADLTAHEVSIERGLVDAVAHLAAIRDGRLYRATHAAFSLYCLERWDLTYRHVNRMIEASRVAGELGPIGPTVNEAQARELSGLSGDAVRDTYTKAAEQAATRGATAPTAADIRAVRRPEAAPAPRTSADDDRQAAKSEAQFIATFDPEPIEAAKAEEDAAPEVDTHTDPLPIPEPEPATSASQAVADYVAADPEYQLGNYRSEFFKAVTRMFRLIAPFDIDMAAQRLTHTELDELDAAIRDITDYRRRLAEAMPRALRSISGGRP